MFCNGCGKELAIPHEPCPNCGALNTSSGHHRSADALTGIVSHIGLVIDDKYQIDSKLGAGGMATVYRATRLLIGDTVAIKILHPDQVRDPQSAERFRREAQAAARLKHPNAVNIYDFGVSTDGLIYLVMELVEGKSIRTMLREGPLTPTTAVEIINQACAALEEAHNQNIVHRDVKPDNIMVRVTPTGLRVKVLDFGIARMRDMAANITQTGGVMGTPHYMSPEQCLGDELDNRSDIYSLGVVLFEMLAGVVPFNSPTSTAVIVQHVNQSPPPLRLINISVPPAIESVVMHALSKRREDRPQSAQLMAEELNRALVGGIVVRGNAEVAALKGDGFAPTLQMSKFASGPARVTSGVSVQDEAASRSRQRLWARVSGAAAVAVLAVTGVWLYATSETGAPKGAAQTEKVDARPNASIDPSRIDSSSAGPVDAPKPVLKISTALNREVGVSSPAVRSVPEQVKVGEKNADSSYLNAGNSTAGAKLIAADPSAPDSTYFMRTASALAAQNQNLKAVDVLAEGATKHPSNTTILMMLARAQSKAGNNTAALASAQRAVSLNPKVEGGYAQIALIHSALDQWEPAMSTLRTGATNGTDKSTLAKVALSLGNTSYKMGNASKNRADLQRAIQFLKLSDQLESSADARFLLGVSAFVMGQSAVTEAQATKNCALARLAKDSFATAEENVPAGLQSYPDAAKQVLIAIPQYTPATDEMVKRYCR